MFSKKDPQIWLIFIYFFEKCSLRYRVCLLHLSSPKLDYHLIQQLLLEQIVSIGFRLKRPDPFHYWQLSSPANLPQPIRGHSITMWKKRGWQVVNRNFTLGHINKEQTLFKMSTIVHLRGSRGSKLGKTWSTQLLNAPLNR